jgi:hypothetical protein
VQLYVNSNCMWNLLLLLLFEVLLSLYVIVTVTVSGQTALLIATDCEHLEEQESVEHPRVDVFLDRRSWYGQSLCNACYVAVSEVLG